MTGDTGHNNPHIIRRNKEINQRKKAIYYLLLLSCILVDAASRYKPYVSLLPSFADFEEIVQ